MDTLQLIAGEPLILKCGIVVNHPTIRDISKFGEEKYWQVVSTFTAVPQDFRVLLDDAGIDCDKLTEFELFLHLYNTFSPIDTSILFGDLDLRKFEIFTNTQTEQLVLYDPGKDIIIDEFIHHQILEFVRGINQIEKEIHRAGNEATRKMMIQFERQNMAARKKEEFKSIIAPQISGLANSAGFKYNYETCMDLPVYVFFDAVKRIQKIKYFDALLGGIYAGTVDSKKLSKDELNWMS